MSTRTVVLVVILLLGALPTWAFGSGRAYYPSGALAVPLLMLLLLRLSGRGIAAQH
jgi:hypothetical protein